MRHSRQPGVDESSILVRSLALRLAGGQRIAPHSHPWPQLIYAARGVMAVETSADAWVVPPQRAVWAPAGAEHAVQMTGEVWMRTLYLRPGLAPSMPDGCCVVNVPPLLRELIQHAVSLGRLDGRAPANRRLAHVLVDQLTATPQAPVSLPLPLDPRARRVADHLRLDPASRDALPALACGSGTSPRTLERLFVRETGMSFGKWRQQARLLHALQRLAEGASVTTVALDVGYENPSAFIAMFRRALGTTPARCFADTAAPPSPAAAPIDGAAVHL